MICVFRNTCSSSVTFPMEFLAHVCNGPAAPAGILAFGSFLDDRLSIKPQIMDGRCGGRDELRTWGRAKKEGELPQTENCCPFQCLYLPWNSLYNEIFRVCWVCPCGMALSIHPGQISWGKDTLHGSTLPPPMALKSPQILQSQNFQCGYFI